MAPANFWAKAKAKVQSALQTFRPDSVNQLSGAMAAELVKVRTGSSEASSLRESLVASLLMAANQVTHLFGVLSL
jgi:hypothetical protein